MALRTVYGNSISEDGWPMVDQGSCAWTDIPGAPGVELEIQVGQPLAIIRALVADYHAFVEPVFDADCACWTSTNSVGSSNHLSGTACDLRWQSHPFKNRGSFNAAQLKTIQEILDFYEGTIFWAGVDWTKSDGSRGGWGSPIDEMHWQMGYNTYKNPHTQDFINRKIRADGYSTFRRGAAPAASNTAQILAQATGLSVARATEILSAVRAGLIASECINVNRIAMWLAQIGHESDNFNATEEYDKGDGGATERWKYLGRTWIQLTWLSNYLGFSKWAFARGLVPTPTYFGDNPKELAELKWAGLGAAYYWTVARTDINALSDARDINTVTLRINGGTNGLPDRQARYTRALTVGDQLLQLIAEDSGEDMAQVPQAQWDRALFLLEQTAGIYRPSTSALRHVGEGTVNTSVGFAQSGDGLGHPQFVFMAAKLGHTDSISLLAEVASADVTKYPERKSDAALATAMLAEVEKTNPAALQNYLAQKGAA